MAIKPQMLTDDRNGKNRKVTMATKLPALVPDRNSASGFRVEYLSVEIDAELAARLEAQGQIDAIEAMAAYEEADVDFLLGELRDAPDREAKRKVIKSFRRQMIRIASSMR